MKASFKMLFAICMSLAVLAAKGEDLAVSDAVTFRLDTSGKALVITNSASLALLENAPITYREGETVAVFAPDGMETVLKQEADFSGTVAFRPTAGGLWRLENSNGEAALIGVMWDVFADGWKIDTDDATGLRLDTEKEGPDRKVFRRLVPPVAYSGDDWMGDLTEAASLAFTSPSGTVTVMACDSGNGAVEFQFPEIGKWRAVVTFTDGTSREAEIVIIVQGMVISFR